MKQLQNPKPVGAQPEFLRPRFWQVAKAEQPPFAKQRLLADKGVVSVAALMGISEADYTAIESGSAAASAKSIIRFCEAVHCHPLDLYDTEADAMTPLPSEIFYSLVDLSENPGFDLSNRRRAKERLELEFKRAISLLRANFNNFKPFMMALNFVSDQVREGNAPEITGRKKGMDSLAALFQTGVTEPGRHQSVDRFIIGYQLELEKRADWAESEELNSFTKWCNNPQSQTLMQWYEHVAVLHGNGDLYNLSQPENGAPFRALG